jgi:hypothetical protein
LRPLSINENALSWLLFCSSDGDSDFRFYFELTTIPNDWDPIIFYELWIRL